MPEQREPERQVLVRQVQVRRALTQLAVRVPP